MNNVECTVFTRSGLKTMILCRSHIYARQEEGQEVITLMEVRGRCRDCGEDDVIVVEETIIVEDDSYDEDNDDFDDGDY